VGLVGALAALAFLAAGVAVAAPRASDPIGLRGFSDCGSLASVVRPRMAAAESYSRRDLHLVHEGAEVEDGSGHGPHLPPDPMFRAIGGDDVGTTTVAPGAEALDLAKLDGTRLVTLRYEGAAEDGTGGELTVRVTELAGRNPGGRGRLGLPGVGAWAYSGLLVLPSHRVLVVGNVGVGAREAVVALIDATDPARPVLLRKETVTGTLGSVWLRDGLVGMVLLARPAGLVQWSNAPPDPALPLVHNWTLPSGAAALLPGREIVDGGGRPVEAGPLLECAHVWAPQRDAGIGMVTIRTLDPGDGDALLERGRAFGVLADDDVVQATADRVYVATTRASWGGHYREPTSTQFHAFARNKNAVDYLGSGSLPCYMPSRNMMSAEGHRLRVIVSRGTTYYANETDVFVLTEKKGRLNLVAQRTELWRDEDVGPVLWYPTYAVVHSRSNKGGGATVRRVELHGKGVLGEGSLYADGSISGQMTSVGPGRILVIGTDVARAVGSPRTSRWLQPYLQGSIVALRDENGGEQLRPREKPRPRGLFDKLNLATDVSNVQQAPTYLPDLGIAIVVGDGLRPCSGEPDCRGEVEAYPTVLALAIDAEGTLGLAGRLDDPGQVERVLEHAGRVVLLTRDSVLLADVGLRVINRIPRA
jgi:hypothetical protein